MVINCPECSTKFSVSAEKIPAKGAKLRCARCRHIFFVKLEEEPSESPASSESFEDKAPAAEPVSESPAFEPPQQESAFSSEEPADETDFAFGDSSDSSDDIFGDTDFGFDETPAETEEPAANADFGVEDTPAVAEPESEEETSDAFGFESPEGDAPEIGAGVNDEFDASAFEDETPASDDAFSFDEDYGNLEMEGDEEEEDQSFSFEEEAPSTEQSKPQDEISTEDAAASFTEEPAFPENFNEELPPDEPYAPRERDDYSEQSLPERVQTRKKRGPFATLILFLLVLILALVAAGGVMYWQNGPEALEQLYQRLTGQEAKPVTKGQILVKNLQGSFVANKVAGELLVIQGNAVNKFRESRAAIQVKGLLFDKEGNQLRQKTIFCGNPISTEDLRSLPYDKLEEIMGNQFGESLVNLNVTPEQVIPFTIIFRDIPENLSEFVVEVADSNPAAQ